jgi:hypothetical protein
MIIANIFKTLNINKPYSLKIDFKTKDQLINYCKKHNIKYDKELLYM